VRWDDNDNKYAHPLKESQVHGLVVARKHHATEVSKQSNQALFAVGLAKVLVRRL